MLEKCVKYANEMTSHTQPNIIPSTVNSTVSGQPWCKTEWLLTGGGIPWKKNIKTSPM